MTIKLSELKAVRVAMSELSKHKAWGVQEAASWQEGLVIVSNAADALIEAVEAALVAFAAQDEIDLDLDTRQVPEEETYARRDEAMRRFRIALSEFTE